MQVCRRSSPSSRLTSSTKCDVHSQLRFKRLLWKKARHINVIKKSASFSVVVTFSRRCPNRLFCPPAPKYILAIAQRSSRSDGKDRRLRERKYATASDSEVMSKCFVYTIYTKLCHRSDTALLLIVIRCDNGSLYIATYVPFWDYRCAFYKNKLKEHATLTFKSPQHPQNRTCHSIIYSILSHTHICIFYVMHTYKSIISKIPECQAYRFLHVGLRAPLSNVGLYVNTVHDLLYTNVITD